MSEHVLVAYDESPQAEAALRHAVSKYPEAEITVVHVNDPREWIVADDEDFGGFYSDTAHERARESAREVLAEAEAIAEEAGVGVETALEVGRPSEEIVSYAGEHGVDHIVLGSHGRRGLERFLLGSVAERVARRSPTSVTIIREPRE